MASSPGSAARCVPLKGRISRRRFIRSGTAAGTGLLLGRLTGRPAWARTDGPGILDPRSIPKHIRPLPIPPAMLRTSTLQSGGQLVDYYEIAVREFRQHILPARMGLESTKVWGYGSIDHPGTSTTRPSPSKPRGAGRCA